MRSSVGVGALDGNLPEVKGAIGIVDLNRFKRELVI